MEYTEVKSRTRISTRCDSQCGQFDKLLTSLCLNRFATHHVAATAKRIATHFSSFSSASSMFRASKPTKIANTTSVILTDLSVPKLIDTEGVAAADYTLSCHIPRFYVFNSPPYTWTRVCTFAARK